MEISKNDLEEEKPKHIYNYGLEKIYTKILSKDFISYKFNKIVLGTKRLISNNLNYNDFSKEYDDKTKIISFKYPNLDYFPLHKNMELISLGKVKYSFNSINRKVNSKIFPYLNKESKTISHNFLSKSSQEDKNHIILNKFKLINQNNNIFQNNKEVKELNSIKTNKRVGNTELSNLINKNSKSDK